MTTLRIALTPGEPAGVGPDLVLQIAQQPLPIELVVIADPEILKARAQQLHIPVHIDIYNPNNDPQPGKAFHLTVLPITAAKMSEPGKLDTANVSYILETLARAATGCMQHEFAAVVTGPVNKGIINDAGIDFSGHTEFFADLARVEHVVMLLATNDMRVALATTHLPLRAVADAITQPLMSRTLQILYNGLQNYFGIPQPRITVCGLNPHAGEHGHLGQEEITVIIPALEQLRKNGMQIKGPIPADTAFTRNELLQTDAILALYHDQGLPVLKHSGFHEAVNITLGLPFIRTSVDHGTALNLAGSGIADSSSLIAAIRLATNIARRKKQQEGGLYDAPGT